MKFTKVNVFMIFTIGVFALFGASKLMEFANAIFDRTYTSPVDSGGYVATLIYVIVLVLTLVFDKNLKHGNYQTPLLFVLIVGFSSYILRYFGTSIAERISFYFVFSQLALLPNAKNIFGERDRAFVRLIIITLAVSLMAYRLYGSDFVPYKFFWSL